MTTSAAISFKRRAMLGTMLAAAAAATVGPGGGARADAPADLVDLKVVDRETGQALQVWPHHGRLFVAGQPGGRYSLRVTNHSDGRVLVVMSVDGVNVISGQTAAYNQTGYVLFPRQAYDVTGWRKSDTEVAAFTFAPLPQSYAARTGRPQNVGVIGLAAFREKPVPPPPAPAVTPLAEPRGGSEIDDLVVTAQRRGAPMPVPPPAAQASRATPMASMLAERRADKLGTGHGEREYSAVHDVPFERASAYPQLVRRIEYDSYDNLVALGVVRPRPPIDRWPRPFPSSPGHSYVPDPPGGR
ncbi:MAG: hypothetical protein JSR98_05220 [Proteobacteria bacterium]|nr:hypothetical protein [Pseudomonadota bacterium]